MDDIEWAVHRAEAGMEGLQWAIQSVEDRWDAAMNWMRGPAKSMTEIRRRQEQAERLDQVAEYVPGVDKLRAGYVVIMDKDLAGNPADANDRRHALLTGLSPGGLGSSKLPKAVGPAAGAAVKVHDNREYIPGYIQHLHSARLEFLEMKHRAQREVDRALHPKFESMREWDPFPAPANQGLEPRPGPPPGPEPFEWPDSGG